MSRYLPDTDIAAIASGKDIFTYVQTDAGVVFECKGKLRNVRGKDNVYSTDDNRSRVVSRWQDGEVIKGAPKLFTPLAATEILVGSVKYRHLFYLDDDNILRGVKNSGDPWEDNGLASLNIKVAHYSKLAAVTVESDFRAICVFYELPTEEAVIKYVSFSTRFNKWELSQLHIKDPPLHGTSLSALPPRAGISRVKDSLHPVVYLQWDSFVLADYQDGDEGPMRTGNHRFAPHTSISVVDDLTRLYCFYTSSRNNNIKAITIENGKLSEPVVVATPTPRSAIASVIARSDQRIVLFYQSLDADRATVEILGVTYALPFKVSSTAPAQLESLHTSKFR